MPRPQKCRRVCRLPETREFRPYGHKSKKNIIILAVEEYEALRLIDKEGFSQEQCSEYMQVARTTVQQIYASARKKVSLALVDGSILRIEGGAYTLCDGKEKSCGCGGCSRHRKLNTEKE